ncbi:hypothetical protein HOY82DRAFT_618929 [Tuber indicum]|nr:hypothetical protein HOY82DRAFT_618929 [Tuber indicum]
MVQQKEAESAEKELEKAQCMLDNAKKIADSKVRKEWKEISKQMRKAVKDRNKQRWLKGLLGREIGHVIAKECHLLGRSLSVIRSSGNLGTVTVPAVSILSNLAADDMTPVIRLLLQDETPIAVNNGYCAIL